MSYILDALRRAQAERERGQVPGLNAQTGMGNTAPGLRPPQNSGSFMPAWAWATSGALLAVVVLLGLTQMRGSKPPLAGAAAVPTPATVPTPSPASSAVSAMAPAPPPPAPPLVVVSAPPAPRRVVPAPAPPPPKPKAAPSAVTPPASAQSVQAGAAPLPPVLTAELKSRWPALVLGGTVWSDTPSARFIILGGQVVREGQATPDGVVVERITPTAAVLRWREERATLMF